MKKLLFFSLFLLPLFATAQYRGLFLPDNNGGTTLATNEKRIALVVGNKSYRNGWSPLRNAANDANTMTSALQDCGFEVTTLTDANRTQFLEAIRTFKGKIQGNATVALFFYAGHGLEEGGQNYLIPTDDASKCRNEIEDNGIKLNSIQKQLKDAGAAMSILIVDACRNQPMPFTCPSSNRSGTSSIFTEFKAKGSYIAFSTAPGQTALDGSGNNSPYTTALSKAIRKEGDKIEDVFKQVRRELDQIGQETWDNNGYSGDFYFKYKNTPTLSNNVTSNTTKDSDNDGIIDSKDNCPYEYGEMSNNGCPKKKISNANFTENHDGLGLDMVLVEGGTFTMGSDDGEADEKPTHQVTLFDFHIGKYEVTQRQWRVIMGTEPSYFKNCDDCPVEQVSWSDVQDFIKKLNQKTGKKYRLPTEAEWEYAARGGKRSKGYTYSGSNTIGEVAQYEDNSNKSPNSVGSKNANELGIYDMSGNVWEWCSDWYGDKYNNSSATSNPIGANLSSDRVHRGGSWYCVAGLCRISLRNYDSPEYRFFNLGFRLCSSL
jgi:formylglycine-generating enzyme required for sulfatase activity